MLSQKNRVHIEDNQPAKILHTIINNQILNQNYTYSMTLVILCIGTDRSTGDSLGPLTGTILKKNNVIPTQVFGDIEQPVHASNLDQFIKKINTEFSSPFIIAIDAGLGKKSSVGYIDVKEGPLKPGTGVNKKLTRVGNMHITGLVNVGGYMEYLVLQSTRLSLVLKMSEIIATALEQSCQYINSQTTIAD